MGDLISGALPKASSQEDEEESPSLASWERLPWGIQTYPREDLTDSGSPQEEDQGQAGGVLSAVNPLLIRVFRAALCLFHSGMCLRHRQSSLGELGVEGVCRPSLPGSRIPFSVLFLRSDLELPTVTCLANVLKWTRG